MYATNFTNKELSIITLNDVKRFLIRKGFKFQGVDKREHNSIFQNTINKSIISLRVPNKEGYSDFLDRISILINALSDIYDTDKQIIYNEVIHSVKDIIKMRIINPGKYQHSLPLDYAVTEISAIKDLFLYSACSEVIEVPYFEKPLTEGLKHLQTCQFGHTFEGSFGFTINIPIIKQDQILLIEGSGIIPFERKVSERIIRGLLYLQKAVKENSSDILVNSFESGLNARMCDSIIDMTIESSKDIEVSAEWSLEYSPDQSILTNQKILIGKNECEILKDASTRLKKVEPYDQIIIGNVITLHSKNDPNLDEDFLRTIIMRHNVNGKSIEVKIYLSKSDYLIAYNAHGTGRKIKISGKIYRTGSTWKMNEVTNISYYEDA